jgi:hypothetical protein
MRIQQAMWGELGGDATILTPPRATCLSLLLGPWCLTPNSLWSDQRLYFTHLYGSVDWKGVNVFMSSSALRGQTPHCRVFTYCCVMFEPIIFQSLLLILLHFQIYSVSGLLHGSKRFCHRWRGVKMAQYSGFLWTWMTQVRAVRPFLRFSVLLCALWSG